jgi:hypothetical protein
VLSGRFSNNVPVCPRGLLKERCREFEEEKREKRINNIHFLMGKQTILSRLKTKTQMKDLVTNSCR